MCGLCGMAGPGIQRWDLTNFRELLYVTNLRGGNGTGVAQISASGIKLKKMVYDASYFLGIDANSKSPIIESIHALAYLGHCRYATVGKVTESNSHPFDTKNIIGAHNGTLVERRFTSDKTKTDSEMMFEEMSETNISSVLRSLFRSSAYAISAFDKRDRRFYLGTNGARPLAVAFLKNRDVMYWASELDALQLILGRNRENFDLYTLAPNNLYSIRPTKISSKKVFDNWRVDDVEYSPPKTANEWRELLDKFEKDEVKDKTTTHNAPTIPAHDIPDFLKNPVSSDATSISDLCFRCRKPLTEMESFTCQECKSTAARNLNPVHDVQSSDPR